MTLHNLLCMSLFPSISCTSFLWNQEKVDMTLHNLLCMSLFQTIQQTFGAKQKLQFAEGVLFDLNSICLCSHCLHCQENQHVDQWNFCL
jgi:hypothetical protein